MKRRRFVTCLVVIVLVVFISLTGCQSNQGASRITMEAEYLRRQDPDFLSERRNAANRDAAYLALRRNFDTGTERSLLETLYYGNDFIISFSEDKDAAAVAYRLAWTSLFLLRELQISDHDFFVHYGTNLEMFCRAFFYADITEELEQGSHFQQQVVDMRNLVEYGFEEQSALFLYLQTQRIRRIIAPTAEDAIESRSYYSQVVALLENLHARYPQWLPEIVEDDIKTISNWIEEGE